MRKKVDQGIYQVDLVAGLFGGFLLIWITSAREAQFSAEPVEIPVLAVIETTLVRVDQRNETRRYSLVSPAVFQLACLSDSMQEDFGLPSQPSKLCPTSFQLAGREGISQQTVRQFAFNSFPAACASPGPSGPNTIDLTFAMIGQGEPIADFQSWAIADFAMEAATPSEHGRSALDPTVDDPPGCTLRQKQGGFALVYVVPPSSSGIWEQESISFDRAALVPQNILGLAQTDTQSLLAGLSRYKVQFDWRVNASLCIYRDKEARCFRAEDQALFGPPRLELWRVPGS